MPPDRIELALAEGLACLVAQAWLHPRMTAGLLLAAFAWIGRG